MAFTIDLPGGGRVPMPAWARNWIGVIAILGLTLAVYRHFYPVEPELVSVKHANQVLRMEIEEYNRHIVDEPMAAVADPSGVVSVRMFHDGCLLIWRKIGAHATTKLLIEPSRLTPSARQLMPTGPTWPSVIPPVHASEAVRQGRCYSAHPGPFRWFYGARLDACWIEVWRQFNDGCQHVQLFNTCSGYWATNLDGSPQLRWTRCVH